MTAQASTGGLGMKQGALIGIVQGLCLPFRGFSRSGATISTGLLAGVEKSRAEAFSFALAVALTPAADGREVLRLMKAEHIGTGLNLASAMVPSLIGMVCAFVAGLLALKWLSKWLESDRWYLVRNLLPGSRSGRRRSAPHGLLTDRGSLPRCILEHCLFTRPQYSRYSSDMKSLRETIDR